MKFERTYLTMTIACLMFGFSGSGMAGCGSGDDMGPNAASIDSALVGVYAVTRFQASPLDPDTGAPVPDSCDELSPANPPGGFLAMYGYRPEPESVDVWLAATFCGSVEECRSLAAAGTDPTLGYSFIQGSDQSGWTGYAPLRTVPAGDQCRSDIQVHSLAAAGESISIGTDTFQVDYMPDLQGTDATCRTVDAINAVTSDLPCQARLTLEATREANL